MRIVRNLILVIAALLLQSTLAETISIYQIKPDFVLIVVVLMSFTDGRIMGTVFGFLAGWLQDVYSPEFLGLNALCKTVIGFLVGYASGGVLEANILVQGIVLFIAVGVIAFFLAPADYRVPVFFIMLIAAVMAGIYFRGKYLETRKWLEEQQ